MNFTPLPPPTPKIAKYTLNFVLQSFKSQNSVLFLLTAFEKLEMVGKQF
jgi:hypothetical protein